MHTQKNTHVYTVGRIDELDTSVSPHPEHVPRVTIPSRDSGNPWGGGSGEPHFFVLGAGVPKNGIVES